jgi:hypothetical protein
VKIMSYNRDKFRKENILILILVSYENEKE